MKILYLLLGVLPVLECCSFPCAGAPLSLEDSEADDWLMVRDLPAHYQLAVDLQLGAYKDSLLAMFPRYVRQQAPADYDKEAPFWPLCDRM